MKRYDLVVVGGGTAGLVSAVIAAGAGARVAMIEADRSGGDCLWTGCVPSKSLIAAADAAQTIRDAARFGVIAGEPEIDFGRVMDHVDAARARIAPHDSPERLRDDGVEVIEGHGRFLAPGRIDAAGRELAYRAAIVATGSTPALPPIPGLEDVEALSTDSIWSLRELPPRLAVLGGGAIGCELGQAFARLGSEVTLIESAPRLLPGEEPEAGALIGARLRAEGVSVRLGAEARAVRPQTGGGATIELEGVGGAEPEQLACDQLLVATGRSPVVADLGLDRVGVETGAGGGVVVDSRLRTTGAGIYAAGDVTAEMPFTHVAAYHARVATLNALFGLRRRVDYTAVPRAIFTDPEVAAVGLSEREARERWGKRATVVSFDYADLDRAITADRVSGFAKLVGDPRGKLLGATVAAPAAAESIGELSARIAAGDGIGSISAAVHAYPTFAEGPARAADEYLRQRYAGPWTRALTVPLLALLRRFTGPGRR